MQEDSLKVDALIQLSRNYYNDSWDNAIRYANEAKDLAARIGYKKGEALAFKGIGIAYYVMGQPVSAIGAWEESLKAFRSLNDKSGIANILGNLGGVYERSDEAKAMEYYLQSLSVAEEIGDNYRIATMMLNLGALYDKKSATAAKAMDAYRNAIAIATAHNYPDALGMATGNIGDLFLKKGEIDSALHYFKLAELNLQGNGNLPLALNNIGRAYLQAKNIPEATTYHQRAYQEASRSNNKLYMTQALLGLADIEVQKGENGLALKTYLEAEQLATELKANDELNKSYEGLSATYSRLRDYSHAYQYQVKLTDLKQKIYNKEADDKIKDLQFEFDLQKKETEINLLSRDKALQDVEIRRQRFAKNALTAGLIGIIAIVFILYRGYRNKVRTNQLLDKQKIEIEHLLLNILPEEVAHELQTEGSATPKNFEQVSVLFTDFKGFTKMADVLSPQELVAELNECFMAFDEIIEKHHLEKIKTIGDSYMCAGGIPVPDSNHATHIIEASFDIIRYLEQWNSRRIEKGLQPWELRIGIHVGPVVAGVVGKKKYAYDIWGSTVNIASRMESAGEPGKVNISSSMFELVRDQYECRYRGKIYAKNIGEIDMYFVDGVKAQTGEIPLAMTAS
ncbi:putative adenylate cyclase [Flavihumibacter petaseus NBRC 106054]|uniref:Putative adenylate cyclase n=2 Tax=Flavihumibacter TaxID=1004301 RepID=A0A0E9MUY9_9BACT|nr:putative adenylate cyclase [Flavihumibacter petaseus NBRC 106054]